MKIETESVVKTFGNVVAVDQVSVSIDHSELFTFLGPSGCGKTTFLRCVAGFELVDSGTIEFDGKDVTTLPPYKRNTGMVFQNYALWPHMTVFENVAFGLKIKKLPKREIKEKVEEVLGMVRLPDFENRTPHQLSGGQQQRVALARALVISPKALLFDEPLSNLDAKLRLEMRAEIRRIQRELGITTLYVTHDQEEAMSISDRIAIMDRGRVMQVGSPRNIYFNPENSFVADFIGQGSFLQGRVDQEGEILRITLDTGETVRAVPSDPDRAPKTGDHVLIAIRPENLEINGKGDNSFKCDVYHISFLGKTQRVMAKHQGATFIIDAPTHLSLATGQEITVSSLATNTLAIKT